MFQFLLEAIKSYVNDRWTRRDLEAWLLIHLQEILDSRDGQAIDLANKLDVDLLELADGRTDEETFTHRVQAYLQGAGTIRLSPPEPLQEYVINPGAHARTFRSSVRDLVPVADYRIEGVFV